jgi:glutathione synthase/RimK-type ligase-like ATP-grasp enzyme
MKIAYISYVKQQRYTQGLTVDEESGLLEFLKEKGLDIDLVIWNDVKVDWKQYQVAILKSPWDYHENITAFYQWLDAIKQYNIKLLNPVDIVRWNTDKHYLKDIADAGLPVIPSFFLEKGTTLSTGSELFDKVGAAKLVIKPCISAGAKNTLVLTPENMATEVQRLNGLLSAESYLVQPFQEEIKNGEWSFLFFNGEYSHGLLKKPGAGDFRVQHYLGGSIEYPEAEPKHIRQAAAYVKRFAAGTLYARVDGILKNGAFHLMELELIEPYLFLDSDKARFENYYMALKDLLDA